MTNKGDKEINDWKLSQRFKTSFTNYQDDISDILTAVEFDKSGNFLATGESNGKVVVLKNCSDSTEKPKYKYFCEFQSHERKFDYTFSESIEPGIQSMTFCYPTQGCQFLLAANTRDIKLWKLRDTSQNDLPVSKSRSHQDVKPKLCFGEKTLVNRATSSELHGVASQHRSYSGRCHFYDIHTLATVADGETFLSSDSLSVQWWNLHRTDQSFSVLDIQPDSIEKLEEIITCMATDPIKANIFACGTNSGRVFLGDTRQQAICDKTVFKGQTHLPELQPTPSSNPDFAVQLYKNELVSITSLKYAQQGRQIITRNFMSVNVWDTAMCHAPCAVIPIQEYLAPVLSELSKLDYIYDQFDIGVTAEGQLVTGAYGNYCHIIDPEKSKDTLLEIPKSVNRTGGIATSKFWKYLPPKEPSKVTFGGFFNRLLRTQKPRTSNIPPEQAITSTINVDELRYDMRVQKLACHPKANVVALGKGKQMYIYSQ